MNAKVLLVDDHELFRLGVRGMLEKRGYCVVGEAATGREAIAKARELSPDVVVMDVSMPDLDGIEATKGISTELPDAKIVALSIHGGKRFVEKMLQAGAAGYILKDSAPEELVEAVRTVLGGEMYLSSSIVGLVVSQYMKLLSRVHSSGHPDTLTKEELQFVQLLGEGCTETEAAAHLDASPNAALGLREGVLEKLHLSSIGELIEYAGAQKWFAGRDEIESAVQRAATSDSKKPRPTGPQALIEPLTNRELDVLELMAQRLTDKEIAANLSVAYTTIKTHVGNIYQKLSVGNRREAVQRASRLGLLSDG